MPDMLFEGDRFPDIELDLTDGSKIKLPQQAPTLCTALLFYRGAW